MSPWWEVYYSCITAGEMKFRNGYDYVMANNGHGDHYVMNYIKEENHGEIVITVHYSNNKVILSQHTVSYNFFRGMLVPLGNAAKIPLETEMLSFICGPFFSVVSQPIGSRSHGWSPSWYSGWGVDQCLPAHPMAAPGSAPRAYRPKAAG